MYDGAHEAVGKERSEKMYQKFHFDMANGEGTHSTWAYCIVV